MLSTTNRGASYADSLRFQRCIDLWRLSLQVRVARYSILYSDTCFTAQALVRLMLDLQDKQADLLPNDFAYHGVPLFDDVFSVFNLLTQNIGGTQNLTRLLWWKNLTKKFVFIHQRLVNYLELNRCIKNNKKTLIVF